MKRAPWAVLGAIVSLFVGATAQLAAAADPQAAALRSELSAQPAEGGQRRSTVEVPRGNLRGDIVNNARSHPETPHGAKDERAPPPMKGRQNSR